MPITNDGVDCLLVPLGMFLLGSTWDGCVVTVSKITAMQWFLIIYKSESKLACRMLQSSRPPEQTLFIVKSVMVLESVRCGGTHL